MQTGTNSARETDMFMVREVLNCRPGKVGAVVGKFKELNEVIEDLGHSPFRIFTDVSGEDFWTLVLESEHETLGDFRQMEAEVMSDERAGAAMAGYHDLVRRGRREIYKLEV